MQGEVIRGVVTYVPDTYYIEEASVGVDDVLLTHPQQGALMDLGTRLQMTTPETLLEVMHQVDEAKFRQQVRKYLAAKVLDLIVPLCAVSSGTSL